MKNALSLNRLTHCWMERTYDFVENNNEENGTT